MCENDSGEKGNCRSRSSRKGQSGRHDVEAKKNDRCTSTRKETERKTENQVERLV